MKKLSLILVVSFAMALTTEAQTVKVSPNNKVNAEELKSTINPNDVSFLATPENVEGIIPSGGGMKTITAPVRKQLPRMEEAAVDTVQYFAIAQSFHSNYEFNYDGGDIYSYNVGLALNGTKATFTNLFDMYNQSATAWARSYDYPVDGVYDADAKTITIPTTKTGIVCGSYGGAYDAMLLGGVVSESGSINPSDDIVFDVTTDDNGNISTIKLRDNMLARYSYGVIRVYKSFSCNLPNPNAADIISFTESADFGEAFVKTDTEKDITLYNRGGKDAEFVMELESDDNTFTSTAMSGVIPAKSSYTLPFKFNSTKAGEYEGIATLTYDNGTEEKSIVVDLTAKAKDYPDFSAAIKSGNFDVTTNIEFPFEMATLADGTQVAQSGTHGKYGSSWLRLDFTVPDGKLATVSWKGVCNNSSAWYQNAGGYFIDTLDGVKKSWNGPNADMSDSWEFAPGKHFIRFQYDGEAYTGLEENNLYVYDIAYEDKDLVANAAVVNTPDVNLGTTVLEAGKTSMKTGIITIENKGANNLTVNKVTSSNKEFTADISGLKSVVTLESIDIPVTMETSTSGDKEATFTIETSAGELTAKVKASVMDMPDFASIVTEGAEYITGWEVNPDYPFVIKEGKAVNKNAGDNSVASDSWFKMKLDIPKGKLAYVSWEGHSYGRPIDNENYSHLYSSYLYLGMNHPMTSGNTSIYGYDVDASSDVLANDDSWSDYLACIPGSHSYVWTWKHDGSGSVPEGDFAEISNIKIHVIDFEEKNVELLTPEVTFDDSYVGMNRYTTAKVRLHNTGSDDLTVGAITGDAPFYGIETTDKAAFNKNIDVTLWFYPSEAGEFNSDLTIETSAGPVTVKCHGKAKNAADEGYIYLGDFEDVAYGWSTVDEDKDGETWNLGSNLWGDRPEYCHSGSECLASISYSNSLGAVTPDNWSLSPIITIPADGAKLSYYVAAFSPKKWEEHYSMYVLPYDESTFSVEKMKETTPLISETLKEENGAKDGWTKREFDLKDYAGKQIVIGFRHHDCTGQYLLRLDDVNVMKSSSDGISSVINNVPGNAAEYYSIGGQKMNALSNGINIIRTQKEDGTTIVRKVMR